ncbi:hypothetical protein HPB48_012026 [Haemaphysalis longicornis]|uniref:Uncharacterized protein n=1 Tax=Haemaphysalis longicornis TaxID=44386 RepID=A0A9J6G7Z3_HAELO|nr:hypothetical protein HPB48_012026 [Haemaphysalis longicornis]
MNFKLFDGLASTYKSKREKEKKREKVRDELRKKLSQFDLEHKSRRAGNAEAGGVSLVAGLSLK